MKIEHALTYGAIYLGVGVLNYIYISFILKDTADIVDDVLLWPVNIGAYQGTTFGGRS